MWVWFGDSNFGNYTSESQAWDQTVMNTDLIIVKSAGNDRNDDGDQLQTGHNHYGDSITVYTDYHPPDGDYDCIGQIGSSKNIITVGALSDTAEMSSFSSWGPMDDGRVKPDIMANGVALTSTCPTSTYCSKSGTSMSTPAATGAIALIIQRYVDVFGASPSPALMKALLVNTASDLGNSGPDYSYGWGLLDAKAAVDLIDSGSEHFRVDSLTTGSTLEYSVTVSPSSSSLRVTIAWTDPAGSPGAAYALVKDIDLEIIDPSGGTYRPWILNPAVPSSVATSGINSVDMVSESSRGTKSEHSGNDMDAAKERLTEAHRYFPLSSRYVHCRPKLPM
jgi:subtilisin family serine protease